MRLKNQPKNENAQPLVATINPIQPQLSFEGLNKVLKHRVFEFRKPFKPEQVDKVKKSPKLQKKLKQYLAKQKNLKEELLEHYPKSKGIVGNIVPDWIKDIPKSERKEKIQGIYKAFAEVATIFRAGEKTEYILRGIPFSQITPDAKTIQEASEKLSKTFEDAGLNCKDFKLLNLGEGAFGTAFKFNINNSGYVVKTYHNLNPNLDFVPFGHGNFQEISRNFFLSKISSSIKNRAKFYFGDIESGYAVTKYVKNTDEIGKKPQLRLAGLKQNDTESKNSNPNGVIKDLGGLEVIDIELASIKQARYDLRQKELKRIQEQLQNFDNLSPAEKNHLIDNAEFYPHITEIVLKKLKIDDDIDLRKKLANIVPDLAPKNQLNAVEILAKAPEVEIRQKLVGWVDCLSPKNQLGAVEILAKDTEPAIRSSLATLVDRLASENQISAVRILAKDPEPSTRELLTFRVPNLAPKNQISAVEILAKDEEPFIRGQLVFWLNNLASQNQLDAVKILEKDPDPSIKIDLASLVESLTPKAQPEAFENTVITQRPMVGIRFL